MKTSYKHAFLDNKAFNSLEKARFCEVVMGNGMYEGTDTSVSNYISNILTIYILLSYIKNISLYQSLQKYKALFPEKIDFLLWLKSPLLQLIEGDLINNIQNLTSKTSKTSNNCENADISEKNSIRGRFRQVKKYRFRSKTILNLVKLMIMLLSSDISAKNGLKRIALKIERSMTRPDLVKFLLMASTTDNSTKKCLLEVRSQFDRSMTKYKGES